jgi:hypothetical protein
MTELLNYTEEKQLTLEQLTIRVKALEKVVLAMLEILSVGDK